MVDFDLFPLLDELRSACLYCLHLYGFRRNLSMLSGHHQGRISRRDNMSAFF